MILGRRSSHRRPFYFNPSSFILNPPILRQWLGLQSLAPVSWTCGHCGLLVGGNLGFYKAPLATDGQITRLPAAHIDASLPRLLICPQCEKPTFFEGTMQVPAAPFGVEVAHLPPDVAELYREARNCMSVAAFTAAVLATRKLLMNVAVSVGAAPNGTFQSYVAYLADNGYVPPNARAWIDHIRRKGNEATHEIPAIDQSDARDLLTFMEMILKLVFEFPRRLNP